VPRLAGQRGDLDGAVGDLGHLELEKLHEELGRDARQDELRAASGAVETVPLIRVVNLARTLDELGELGFWRLAFADDAVQQLSALDLKRDLVLVLGAEGEGLRRLTRERCDLAVHLPTNPKMPSLNVSNAAAVALYACAVAVPD